MSKCLCNLERSSPFQKNIHNSLVTTRPIPASNLMASSPYVCHMSLSCAVVVEEEEEEECHHDRQNEIF